jgi:hypothetical protein
VTPFPSTSIKTGSSKSVLHGLQHPQPPRLSGNQLLICLAPNRHLHRKRLVHCIMPQLTTVVRTVLLRSGQPHKTLSHLPLISDPPLPQNPPTHGRKEERKKEREESSLRPNQTPQPTSPHNQSTPSAQPCNPHKPSSLPQAATAPPSHSPRPPPIDPALRPERFRVFNSSAHRNTVDHEDGPAGKKYSNARPCVRSCGGMVGTSGRQRRSSFTTALTKGRDGMSAMQGRRRRGLSPVPLSAPSALSTLPSPPEHRVNLRAL